MASLQNENLLSLSNLAVADPGLPDADDSVCAICLDQVPVAEVAIVRGCDHIYCVKCILSWAACKDPCTCPQCKHPFEYLLVHRQLDGTYSDCLLEESVVLLKRASWFHDHTRVLEKGHDVGDSPGFGADSYYDYEEEEDDDYDEDEQLEDLYYSRATGRNRIVIGNRRWGENGLVRGGRMYARPVAPPPPPPQPAVSARSPAGSRTPAGKQPQGAGGSRAGAGSGSSSGQGGSSRAGTSGVASSINTRAGAGAGSSSGTSTGGPASATAGLPAIGSSTVSSTAVGDGPVAADVAGEQLPTVAATEGSQEPADSQQLNNSSSRRAAGTAAASDGSTTPAAGPSASRTVRSNQIGRPGSRGPATAAAAADPMPAAGKAPGRRAKRSNRRAANDWGDDDGWGY